MNEDGRRESNFHVSLRLWGFEFKRWTWEQFVDRLENLIKDGRFEFESRSDSIPFF